MELKINIENTPERKKMVEATLNFAKEFNRILDEWDALKEDSFSFLVISSVPELDEERLKRIKEHKAGIFVNRYIIGITSIRTGAITQIL
jgi:hypothetical protein